MLKSVSKNSKLGLASNLLFLFATFLIINGISEIPMITEIGKYGKFIVPLIGVPLLSTFESTKIFFKKNRLLIFFGVLCFIFSSYSFYEGQIDPMSLLTNATFLIYIIFIYLITYHFSNQVKHDRSLMIVFISKKLARLFNMNLFIWTIIGIVLDIPLFHQLDDRIGLGLFYHNYIQLGIFAVCGALVHLLLLKYHQNRGKNIMWLLVYILIIFLSNSRNAQLIILTTSSLLYFKSISLWLIKFRWILILVLGIVVLQLGSITNFLLNDEILKFTTGRSTIWNLVLDHYKNNSVFAGNGIFGLNNEILLKNKSYHYYFDRIDFLYFHNSYLEFFTAAGIVGFICILLYFLTQLKKNYHSTITPVLIGIFAGAFFESFLIQPVILITMLFWIYLFTNQTTEKIQTTTTIKL